MSQTDSHTTVADLVVENPARSRIFERFGIDYCCGGKKPLSQACREKGLDEAEILAELDAIQVDYGNQRDWSTASLRDLTEHIITTHHDFLRRELPRLDSLTSKVAAVHGGEHPELVHVRQVFLAFKQELEQHMYKEERILFPLCAQLERGDGSSAASAHCGSIRNPIRVMIMEHDHAGDAMGRMRELTYNYAVPTGACGSYRAMLEGLLAIELDMHQHVHKENNILFPRAIELEARQATQ